MSNGWGGKRAHAGRKPKHPRADMLCPVAKNNRCPYLRPLLRLADSSDPNAARNAAIRLREQFGVALDLPPSVPGESLDAAAQPAQAQAAEVDNPSKQKKYHLEKDTIKKKTPT